MPLFEYKCKKCGHQFEALVAGDWKPKCVECGSSSLEKLLSSFSAPAARGGMEMPCASGACNTDACSTGSCPFSG